ncbi:hypothetical protein DRJ22_02225 [Candidatus Woesearchaeota archaeon]|nr:MAG: hypothetical protein DRJ22_02225 [Candidatus Woesearchaeota archaeon]
MEIEIDIKRSLEKNAAGYFEKAKRFRKKAKGAEEAVVRFEKQLHDLEKKKKKELIKEEKREKLLVKRSLPVQWYEKFHWFISSENFLCIGGRDATSNEIIIKKHSEKNDLIFHSELPGSPFFVIKTMGKKPGSITIRETAKMTLTYSKAWRMNISAGEVYYVLPEQVSKKAPSGEYVSKGSFMISGKRNFVSADLDLAVGLLDDNRAMAAPLSAVKKHCKKFKVVLPGRNKPSDCAKKIAKELNVSIDEIMRLLPGGSCEVKK